MDVSGGGGARLENARDDIVVVVVVSRARLASARSGVVMAVDASESADGGMASESARARGNDALARREYDEAIRLYVESHDAGTTGGDRARAKANEAAVSLYASLGFREDTSRARAHEGYYGAGRNGAVYELLLEC